jgi:hypothetical protein
MPPSEAEIRQLFEVHNSAQRRSELLQRSYGFDDLRTWIDPAGHKLSDRIWNARRDVYDQIDTILRRAIADGTDALEVARILEAYLNPEYAPVRNERGRLIRNQRPGIVTRAPGRSGMGSFSARRLARTEISRAHGAATIWSAERTPFAVGVRWSISGRHPKKDPCDVNARRDSGLGAGVYEPKNVPRYPNHPMCLCHLSTVVPDDTEAVVAQLRDKYGLDTEAATPEPTPTVPQTPGAQSAIPTTKPAIRQYIESLGVRIDKDEGNAKVWRMVAEVLAAEKEAGRELPPLISFSTGKSSVAQYVRSSDARTGAFLREYIEFSTRSSYWKDPAAVAARQHETGFWSASDPLHAITHELGHFHHARTAPPGDAYGYTIEINGVKVDDRFPHTGNERRIAERVSTYGASRPTEFVAETYAAIRAGKTFDDEVMELYRKYGGPSV